MSAGAAAGSRHGRRAGTAWVILAALLALATVHLHRDVEAYRPLGGERLAASGFAGADALEAWQVEAGKGHARVEDGVLVLEAPPEDAYVSLRQSVPVRDGEVAYRLEAEIRLDGVTPGRRPWERARVYVIGATPDGKLVWDRHEDLVRRAGSTGWTRLAGDFRLAPGSTEAVVLLRLHKAAGRMDVRHVSLLGLEHRPVFMAASHGLMLGWVLLGGWGGALLWRHARHRRAAALLGVAVAGGFWLLLVPHPIRSAVLGYVAALGGNVLAPETVAKLGHFLIFAVIACLARLAVPQVPAALKLAVLLLVAGAGEVLQFMAVDRSPSLYDWGVNSSGVLLGFALGSLALAAGRALGLLGEDGRRKEEEGAEAPSR